MRIMLAIICLVLLTGCGEEDSPSAPSVSQESPFAGNYKCSVNAPGENNGVGYGTIGVNGVGSFVYTVAVEPASSDSVTLRMDFTVNGNTGAVTGNVYSGTQKMGSMDGYYSTFWGAGAMNLQQPEGRSFWDSTRRNVEQ